MLPLGKDNVNVMVDPEDFGSIIAYAMTSNIYFEGLARDNYMNLKQLLMKSEKRNQSNFLKESDDVLNYTGVSNS